MQHAFSLGCACSFSSHTCLRTYSWSSS